jgi:hypothetical protein
VKGGRKRGKEGTNVEVECSVEVVSAEFAKVSLSKGKSRERRVVGGNEGNQFQGGSTKKEESKRTSSQTTELFAPIRYRRVKRARTV